MGSPGTSHPFLRHDGVLAFAHRGGIESAPENTLAAFAAAVDLGFTYLEMDVHLSADGVVVVAHDERLDRVSDTNGLIAEKTWTELSTVRIGGTEPLPRLEELIDSFPGARLNIDAKSDAVVDPLGDLLERHDVLERVCIGGFSQERLARVRGRFGTSLCSAAAPREVAALLAASHLRRGGLTEPPAFGCVQVPLRHKGVPVVTPAFVAQAHRLGVQVHVWTIDDPDRMGSLIDLGVDGIMTDRPSVLRSVLIDNGRWHGPDQRRTQVDRRHVDRRHGGTRGT